VRVFIVLHGVLIVRSKVLVCERERGGKREKER